MLLVISLEKCLWLMADGLPGEIIMSGNALFNPLNSILAEDPLKRKELIDIR